MYFCIFTSGLLGTIVTIYANLKKEIKCSWYNM